MCVEVTKLAVGLVAEDGRWWSCISRSPPLSPLAFLVSWLCCRSIMADVFVSYCLGVPSPYVCPLEMDCEGTFPSLFLLLCLVSRSCE